MNMWNERFSSPEYVYGTKPNQYFQKCLSELPPGKLLIPGEGEGRNALHAASQGWDVHAFDASEVGIRKAQSLIKENQLDITYDLNTYEDFDTDEKYDAIALIFTHMSAEKRRDIHRKYLSFLKKGGNLIVQGFRKEQLGLSSGGPKSLEMLWSGDELGLDFINLSSLRMEESDEVLDEGPFHQGMAKLISVSGIK